MSELKYWIWLSQLSGLSPQLMLDVVRHFGSPKQAFFADSGAYEMVPGLRVPERKALGEKKLAAVYQVMEKCRRLGIRAVTIQDTDYPERLRNIDHPPMLLYVRGSLPILDEEAAIAIVGTRKASDYGVKNAHRLAYHITKGGGLVVSGLATGVDTAAAEGALAAGGTVIGVLGCGVNVVYPSSNAKLYERVAGCGALVSEYPPDVRPLREHFPARNRILSGLSAGVVVIEAPERSGALITASRALDQGRELFVVPGNIDSPLCVGSNNLLREGSAKAISTAEDVLCEFRGLYGAKLAAGDERNDIYGLRFPGASGDEAPVDQKAPISPKIEVDKDDGEEYIDIKEQLEQLSEDELAVLSRLTGRPTHVDDVIEAAALPAGRVLAALTVLEIKGHVAQHAGKRFSLVVIR